MLMAGTASKLTSRDLVLLAGKAVLAQKVAEAVIFEAERSRSILLAATGLVECAPKDTQFESI